MNVDVRPTLKSTRSKGLTASNTPRVLLLSSCLLVMMFSWGPLGNTPKLAALLMAALLTGVALFKPMIVSFRGRLRQADQVLLALLLVAGLILTGAYLAGAITNLASPSWIAVVSAYTILGLAGTIPLVGRLPHLVWVFWIFLAVHAALTVVFLHATPTAIDVQMFQHDGAAALLNGHNPYSMTFPNLYSPRLTEMFYGHGVVANGRITYGFPYLPVTLLVAIPGQLLGDVRYSQLIAMLVTGLVLRRLAKDRYGRAAAVLGFTAPVAIPMLSGAWTEPTLVALLACLVLALERRKQAILAVFLGLFLVSKQYVAVALPIVWLIRQSLTRRVILIGLGVATAVTLPFFLVNPPSFWKAIVEFQLVQPFRADSVSLLVSSVTTFGWPPPWTYGVLPIAGGGLTAMALALRAPRTPAALAAGVGLTLLVTILLSKQAFMNYYFIVSGALLIATVAWPTQQPLTAPEQRS